MSVVVHPHALKHGIGADAIVYAWEHTIRRRQRGCDGDPPTWIAVGILPDGRLVELVAVLDDAKGWRVFHAMAPPTKKFLRELGLARRLR